MAYYSSEHEVQPEKTKVVGFPVQEICCVKTRLWSSSDKQSLSCPVPAGSLGANSIPATTDGEEMTKTDVEEMVEVVEEGKMEGKVEEKATEAQLVVLGAVEGFGSQSQGRFEGVAASSHSPQEQIELQEAVPHPPTLTAECESCLATPVPEQEPRPDSSPAEAQIKVTDRRAGQRKGSRRRPKAKPSTVEPARAEGSPRNNPAPFHLKSFMHFRMSNMFTALFLLGLLLSPVNSRETSVSGQCAVCPEERCINTTVIWPAKRMGSKIWTRNETNGAIPDCSMANLKSEVPCKMPNGHLVLQREELLNFEGNSPSGGRDSILSENKPCTKLNLPASLPSSPGTPSPISLSNATSTNGPARNATTATSAWEIVLAVALPVGVVAAIIAMIAAFFHRRFHCHGNDVEQGHQKPEEVCLNGKAANGNADMGHPEETSVV